MKSDAAGGDGRDVSALGEEARALLRQIVERQAYRQLMAGNIRGHGIQFLPDLDAKIRFTAELDHSLRVLREVERAYREIGGEDLYTAVRARTERIPYPVSRMELAVCLSLTGRAERAAAASYRDCVHPGFAAVARTLIAADRAVADAEERMFVEYCAEGGHHPQAQQYWNRWLAIALLSLGRPGTRRDRRAVELGLRSKHAAEVVRDFLDDVEPLRRRCGLAMPALDGLGVELPEDLRGRFLAAGLHG